MMDIRLIARILGGEFYGQHKALVPGPGHRRNDRSLSIKIGFNGKLVVNSFAGEDWRACRNYVLNKLGLREAEIALYGRVHHARPETFRGPEMSPERPAYGRKASICAALSRNDT
jgi:hypothetical protein